MSAAKINTDIRKVAKKKIAPLYVPPSYQEVKEAV
jgi:hypothetical protein